MINSPSRILIADDDAPFRRLVVRLLEREGYEVEQANDATEALACLSARTFELLVADVNMPDNEGLAVLHNQDAVPVLIVTGDPTVETAVAALRGAAVDYLAKPLSPDRFLARVADGVARGRALRTLKTAEERLRGQLELVMNLRASLAIAGVPAQHHLPELGTEPVAGRANDPSTGQPPLPSVIAELLSPREREVLYAFQSTPRITDVATGLHISPHTVKNHLKAMFRKLEVSSQAELLARLAEAERDGR